MAVWPGTKKVALMSCSASSAMMRRTACGPNSPREMALGELGPSPPIQTDMAS